IYLDFSLPLDPLASSHSHQSNHQSNSAVVIPKYNNYPIRKHNIDDITKAIIPLKLLNVPSIEEVRSGVVGFAAPHHHHSFTRPNQNALVGYSIFTSMAHFLPSNTDSTVRYVLAVIFEPSNLIITYLPDNVSQCPSRRTLRSSR